MDAVLLKFSEWYLDREYERRKAKAISVDPKYARIQTLRKEDTHGIVFIDYQKGLSWAEWDYQMDVERAVLRDPKLLPVARWAGGHPVGKVLADFFAGRQRAQRGWDFRATYSLDFHLASTLGPQLLRLADDLPDDDGDWLKELRAAGEALVRYAKKDDEMWLTERTHGELVDLDTEIGDAAKSAIHWVAANLTRLRSKKN